MCIRIKGQFYLAEVNQHDAQHALFFKWEIELL